jgi:hypothetical protein
MGLDMFFLLMLRVGLYGSGSSIIIEFLFEDMWAESRKDAVVAILNAELIPLQRGVLVAFSGFPLLFSICDIIRLEKDVLEDNLPHEV